MNTEDYAREDADTPTNEAAFLWRVFEAIALCARHATAASGEVDDVE